MNSRKNFKIKAAIFTFLFFLFISTIGHTQAEPIPSLDYAAYEKDSPIEMVIQSPHNYINDSAFSPDGRYIASGGSEGIVKLWRVSDGRIVKNLLAHSGWVEGIAFSPDGRFFASCGWDNLVRLWSINGRLTRTFEGHKESVYSIAFSPDGRYIASGGLDKTIKLWTLDGSLIRTFHGHDKLISSVAFSPDGKIASGSVDNTIKLWSIDGKLIKTITGHTESVTSVAFCPDGKHLASASRDKTVKIWNMAGELIRSYEGHDSSVTSIAFSPNGRYIASGEGYGDSKLWRIDSKLEINLSDYGGGNGIAFCPDGQIIAVCGSDISLYNTEGTLIKVMGGIDTDINGIAISPDGSNLAIGGDDTIRLWNLEGRLVRTIPIRDISSTVHSVAFSPDGNFIISGGIDKIVRLWGIDGKLIKIFKGHSHYINRAVFSDDGKYIVSGSNDKTIKLWSVDGRLIRTLEGHSKSVDDVAFSPDGRFIISAGDDNTTRIWTVEGSLVKSMKHSKGVSCLAFSPDGSHFIANGHYNNIQIWSLDGELIKTLKGHSGLINSLAYSADGKFILSGSLDGEVMLWSSEGALIRSIENKIGGVDGVAFSPDGRYIIFSTDNAVNVHNIKTDYNYSLLFSEDEWVMYTPDGYFDSTRNGGSLVSMVKGFTTYGIDQFASRYNRPDIILERLELGSRGLKEHYYSQYLKRLRRMGLSEEQLSSELHIPRVKIDNIRVSGKFAELFFTFSDDLYPLRRCNIYVNDIPVLGAYGKDISGQQLNLKARIELSFGENKIEISCVNEKGAESYREMAFVESKEKVKKNLYFLGFGISEYQDDSLNLRYADKDVLDLADLFSKMEGKAFVNVFTRTYINRDVTRKNIKNAKSFLKNAKVDDTFILFISGHGLHERDNEATYYYLTHNASVENISQTCADFELVENLLQDVAPRNKLFLIDTCESGEIEDQIQSRYYTEAGSRGLIPRTVKGLTVSGKNGHDIKKRPHLYDTNRYIYNDLLRRSGAVVFSSSHCGEFSYERDDIQNGIFTEKIISCLTNISVDTNKDGLISTKEMREFVARSVAAETNYLQHPTVDRDNIYQNIGLPVIQLAHSGSIQLIENSTIEYGSLIPSSWRMSGKSITGTACKLEWAMEEVYSGSRSLKITNPDTNKNWGYWFQTVTQDIPIGKKLTLRAFIKTVDLEGAGTAIAIRGDDTIKRTGPAEYFFTTQKIQKIRGTKDWNEYCLQPSDVIPENIKSLTIFLLLLNGSRGTVYFDNITLDF